MVGALLLAFVIGRLAPVSVTAAALGWPGLHRARQLMSRLQALDGPQRLHWLAASAPRRMVPFLLRHRYLALALAINLPGNTLLGGGGGIALCAGLSGLFAPVGFVATIAMAVTPVPLMFMRNGGLA